MSILASHAETTTSDNLLDNNTFDENTNGWTLSDSNVKRDANSYSDAGNSPTIRFKGQTSTITQSVDTSGLETNKEITDVTVKYHGYGCGNTPNGWCTAGGDDTIVTNVTLKNEAGTEVSTNTTAVPYEDGWTYHTFTKSINDTFLTGETGITFSLQGIDTGDSSGWLGPITDNYELLVTYQDYVAPVVEPVVIEPIVIEPIVVEPIVVIEPIIVVEPVIEDVVVIEPIVEEVIEPIAIIEDIVVIEETIIGGLELSTEITLDLIQEIPTLPSIEVIQVPDLPDISIEMPIDSVSPIEMVELPVIMDTPPIQEIKIEMPVEIVEVEPIQEIQEITIEEPLEVTVEIEPEEINIDIETEEVATVEVQENEGSDLPNQSTKVKEIKNETKSETKKSNKEKSNKEKSKATIKSVAKPKAKATVAKSKSTSKSRTPVVKAPATPQITLPIEYLQVIQDTIIMTETIDLSQEMIYGGQQEYNLNTSGITVVSLDNNSSSRWGNLQNERKRFKAPVYPR